jgi:hypothetical protein
VHESLFAQYGGYSETARRFEWLRISLLSIVRKRIAKDHRVNSTSDSSQKK